MHPITVYAPSPRGITARCRAIYGLLTIAADTEGRVSRPLRWIARHLGHRGGGGGSLTDALRALEGAGLVRVEMWGGVRVWRITGSI